MAERQPVKVAPVKAGDKSDKTDFEQMAQMAAQVGDGRLFKMEVDYASQVDTALPKADELAKSGNVAGALESLSNLEKLSRLGQDMRSNSRIVQHMVKLCFDGQKWDLLNETILTLSKKRLIIKVAVAKMVKDCCAMIEKMPTDALRTQLIDTLRTVTAGKIYVEVERARLTSMVVKRLEAEGKTEEAATMLLELQVETYGSMEIKEKVEYLLEQMRLSVARRDFVRASIISKKISIRFFNNTTDTAVQDLKLKFYSLMIEINSQDNNYIEVCKNYREIFDTPKITSDAEKSKKTLKCVVLYALLAAHSNEQWDLVHRIAQHRELETIPEYKALLELFIQQELISWKGTMLAKYEKLLRQGKTGSPATEVFASSADGDKRWKDLHVRVGEHNMRMISKYYTQISFDRLAELLDFPQEDMESFVCNLIVTGQISDAKIHRPSRVVNLRARKANTEHLDQWSSTVAKLTDTLNKVSHLILKEEMVHRAMEQATLAK